MDMTFAIDVIEGDNYELIHHTFTTFSNRKEATRMMDMIIDRYCDRYDTTEGKDLVKETSFKYLDTRNNRRLVMHYRPKKENE